MMVLWFSVIMGALYGGLQLHYLVTGSEISATEQAARATLAVACAVVPYVLVRAIEKCLAPEITELKRLNETLTGLLAAVANSMPPRATQESEIKEHTTSNSQPSVSMLTPPGNADGRRP